jgi:outer membrane protein TolC
LAALETAGRAVEAWLELAAAAERLAVREAQLVRLEKALDLQRKRLELGETSGAEVKQLELERLRLVGEVNAHRARQTEASQALTRWAGPHAPLPRPGDLRQLYTGFQPVQEPPDESTEWVESSPVLSAAELNTERIRLDGLQARRTVWGRPEAELSWEHIPTVDNAEGYDAFGFRLRFPLPLGNLGKRRAAESAARESQARSDEEIARRELDARIKAEVERSRAADEILNSMGDIETDLAEVEHSINERYRLGAVAYVEYIDGLSRLDEVRTQIIDARLAGSQARLALTVLTGKPGLFPLPEPDEEGFSVTEEDS